MSFPDDLSDLWRNRAVNCLQKELEMNELLVRVFGPKEIGWLGGGGGGGGIWVVLPERDLRSVNVWRGWHDGWSWRGFLAISGERVGRRIKIFVH